MIEQAKNEEMNKVETIEQSSAEIQTPLITPPQEKQLETPQNIQTIAEQHSEVVEIQEKLPHLRPRLVKFCEAKVSCKTDAEAIDIAGFHCKNANVKQVQAQRLLKIATVKAYIEIRERQIQQQLAHDSNVTRAWKLDKLKTVVENCQEKKPREMVAAIAEMNKMQGDYAPIKTDSTVTNKHKVDIDSITNDDCVAFSKRLQRIEDGLRRAKAEKVAEKSVVMADKVALDAPAETEQKGEQVVIEEQIRD